MPAVNQGSMAPGVSPNENPGKTDPKKPVLQRMNPSMRGPSIRDALNGVVTREEKVSVQEQFSAYVSNDLKENFTRSQLELKWNEYLLSLQQRPSLKAALSQVPEITDDLRLEVTVSNSVQLEMVRDIKPQIVSWLRSELRNSGIDLIVRIDDSRPEKMIYTDQEKFQEMSRKNPSLLFLRQKFGLDFEG